jgi:hypothetical protein
MSVAKPGAFSPGVKCGGSPDSRAYRVAASEYTSARTLGSSPRNVSGEE